MRTVLAVVLTMLAAGVAAGSAAPGTFQAEPPACADITGLNPAYDREHGFAFVSVELAASACRQFVYAVFVYADEGDDDPIGGRALRGYDTDLLLFAFDVASQADDDGVVQVCAVSYQRRKGQEVVQDAFGYPNADQGDNGCVGVAAVDEEDA